MTKTDRIYSLERQINKLNGEIIDTKTNHILHLLLTLVSMGFWLPLWIVFALGNANQRQKLKARQSKLELQLDLLIEDAL